MCDHIKFKAQVDIDRTVEQDTDGKVIGVTFKSKIHVVCENCGVPFVFNARKAYTNNYDKELIVPIEAESQDIKIPGGVIMADLSATITETNLPPWETEREENGQE